MRSGRSKDVVIPSPRILHGEGDPELPELPPERYLYFRK